ncbi:MAG: hypothetical protein PVI37_11035, partial [Gammaproteobacteria bacterium]
SSPKAARIFLASGLPIEHLFSCKSLEIMPWRGSPYRPGQNVNPLFCQFAARHASRADTGTAF